MKADEQSRGISIRGRSKQTLCSASRGIFSGRNRPMATGNQKLEPEIELQSARLTEECGATNAPINGIPHPHQALGSSDKDSKKPRDSPSPRITTIELLEVMICLCQGASSRARIGVVACWLVEHDPVFAAAIGSTVACSNEAGLVEYFRAGDASRILREQPWKSSWQRVAALRALLIDPKLPKVICQRLFTAAAPRVTSQPNWAMILANGCMRNVVVVADQKAVALRCASLDPEFALSLWGALPSSELTAVAMPSTHDQLAQLAQFFGSSDSEKMIALWDRAIAQAAAKGQANSGAQDPVDT